MLNRGICILYQVKNIKTLRKCRTGKFIHVHTSHKWFLHFQILMKTYMESVSNEKHNLIINKFIKWSTIVNSYTLLKLNETWFKYLITKYGIYTLENISQNWQHWNVSVKQSLHFLHCSDNYALLRRFLIFQVLKTLISVLRGVVLRRNYKTSTFTSTSIHSLNNVYHLLFIL